MTQRGLNDVVYAVSHGGGIGHLDHQDECSHEKERESTGRQCHDLTLDLFVLSAGRGHCH